LLNASAEIAEERALRGLDRLLRVEERDVLRAGDGEVEAVRHRRHEAGEEVCRLRQRDEVALRREVHLERDLRGRYRQVKHVTDRLRRGAPGENELDWLSGLSVADGGLRGLVFEPG